VRRREGGVHQYLVQGRCLGLQLSMQRVPGVVAESIVGGGRMHWGGGDNMFHRVWLCMCACVCEG
jgi:hypothetical protein